MATITDTDFEGTYPPSGYSEAGTVANIGTSTVQFNSGATSMRVLNGSAATAWIADTVALRMIVMRFYLRVAVKSSGTCSIVQFTNATIGNVYFRLLTTGVIRLTINATNYAGPTLNDNQWYRVDIRVNTSANPNLVDWQIDGSAQTQRSSAVAAADVTAINIGFITSGTVDVYFDDLKVTDQSADYPIGAYIPPSTQLDVFGMSGFFGA